MKGRNERGQENTISAPPAHADGWSTLGWKLPTGILVFLSVLIVLFAILLLVLLQGSETALVISWTAVFLAFGLWMWHYPETALMLLLALSLDVFGILPLVSEFKIALAGGASPAEILLTLVALPVAFTAARRGVFAGHADPAERRTAWLVFFVLLYVVFLVLYASVLTGRATFNEALRIAGGHFSYYVMFLYTIVIVRTREQALRVLNFIRFGALVAAGVSIGSNIVGTPLLSHLQWQEQQSILRIYLPGYQLCVFVIVLGVVFSIRRATELRISPLEIAVNLLGFLLFLGRGWMVTLALMVLSSILLLRKVSSRTVLGWSVVALAMLGLVSAAGLQWQSFLARLQSGYAEVLVGEGTFAERLMAMNIGYQVFASTPVFGTGFIRETSAFYQQALSGTKHAPTFSADFGLASILFTTGIAGFLLITAFVVRVIWRLRRVYTSNQNVFNANLALAVATVVFFDYFVTQWIGNFFGTRLVAGYLVVMGIASRLPGLPKDQKAP